MSPLEAAWLATKDRLPGMDFEQFSKALEGADVHPVMVKGEMAGAIVVRGPEIHACILPWAKGLWLQRKHFSILFDVMKRYGYAMTKATTDQGRWFVEQLGFVKDGDVYKKVNHGT